MEEKILDMRGRMCPIPIVETARVMKPAGRGSRFRVISDDMGFPFDISSWCKSTGNRLVSLKREGDEYTALIEKGGG